MDAFVGSAYAQLLSVGLLWITFHCIGMCGPLVLGLDLGGCMSRPGLGRAWLHVLAYQAGKASTYAVLGFLAGLVGKSITGVLQTAAPWFAAAMGLGLIIFPLRKQIIARRSGPSVEIAQIRRGSFLSRVTSNLVGLAGSHRLLAATLVGSVLAFIPCMIVAWVLALAASTASPIHGALLMVLLAVMTSVPLTVAASLPRLLGLARLPALQRGAAWLMPVSGLWLWLVAAGALKLIPHATFAFHLGGEGYVLMFW